MLTALDHVLVAVENLDAAIGTWARLLGRRPAWRGEHPGNGTRNALFRLENTYLELLSPEGQGPVGDALRAWLAERGDGPLGLAFATDDAAGLREAFADRGLEPGPVEKGLGRDVESGAFREWLRVPLPLERTRGVVLFAIEHRSPDAVLPPSGPLGDEAGCVSGIDHAVVQSPDPEATRALYGDGLGLRLALDREFPQWGMRLLFFRVAGVTVEVAARLPGAETAGPEAETPPGDADRFWGVSWRVPDADAARARLAGLDFDVSELRTGRRPGTRVFTVRGPTHGVATLMLEVTPDGG